MNSSTSPLAGRRILVTRPLREGDDLRERLTALGATVVEAVAIEIVPVDDPAPIDEALGALARYSWLILTSPTGVRVLEERLHAAGRSGAGLGRIRVGAVGPTTARALREAGIEVDIVPAGDYRAEGLIQALRPQLQLGERVLLLRAGEGRPTLREGLREIGAEVVEVTAYRTVAGRVDSTAVRRALRERTIDAVTFASGSAVRNFVGQVGLDVLRGGLVRIVCLGPVTAKAATDFGLAVDRIADEATIDAFVAATVAALSIEGDSRRGGV